MYGGTAQDTASQPLFGETRRRDKIINIVLAVITGFMATITVVMSVLSGVFKPSGRCCLLGQPTDRHICVYFMDIVFAFVILLLLIPQVFVALWYRRGELEPKFRRLIYYNAVVTVLLCLTANLYFFKVGFKHMPSCLPDGNNNLTRH